jgi:hypothetical protein
MTAEQFTLNLVEDIVLNDTAAVLGELQSAAVTDCSDSRYRAAVALVAELTPAQVGALGVLMQLVSQGAVSQVLGALDGVGEREVDVNILEAGNQIPWEKDLQSMFLRACAAKLP